VADTELHSFNPIEAGKKKMASAALQFWYWTGPISHRYPNQLASLTSSLKFATPISVTNSIYLPKPLTVRFALTESDSPKSIGPDPQTLLQEIAVSHSYSIFLI